MTFATGAGWADWERDYRHGALVIEPPQVLASILDPIRERLDPVSAGRVSAHITVTPPFVAAPTSADEARVASIARRQSPMNLRLGRPRQFDGSLVVYLPVEDPAAIMRLREALLGTGLFRLDLPHTTDFVPHLTLSEFGGNPSAAMRTSIPEAMTTIEVRAIAWLVPDQDFRFSVRQTFALADAGHH